MQVCEIFLSKKWYTVMWHRECEQSIHVKQPRGLDLGEKVLALALLRPRPRLFSQGQGQGLHEVSSRILEAKARPRGQQDCKFIKKNTFLYELASISVIVTYLASNLNEENKSANNYCINVR